MADIVRLALSGGIPDREEEGDFIRSHAADRSAGDGVFIGHSGILEMEFPGAIEYTPEGYR